MDNKPKHFFRVHVKLDDPESVSHLAFDFGSSALAIEFAEQAYISCNFNKVWVEIVTNEIDTTESPMWRR